MKKSDILFFLFVIALFLPFFISDTIYEWYKSFNAIHGMVMSFVKFAILATLGEMLGLRISTGVYHNKTFGIIPRMVIWGVLGQLPLEELGNQRISTFESGGIFNDSLAERLCEQPYIQDKIRLIESFLTQALCTNNKIEKQISYAVDCINLSKGQLPIRSLVENVCLCQRHFERKFKHQTGYSPKEYSRIIKFKNAVDLLRSTSSNQLFSVAIEAGYYDTAHLSKEIKALSGNTPGSFLSLPVTEETTLTYLKL